MEKDKLFNFDQLVLGLGDGPIVDNDNKQLTLKDLAVKALIENYSDERPEGQEKRRRGQLAKKIFNGGVVSLSQREIDTVKTLVGKGYPPVIVDAIWGILEGPGERRHVPAKDDVQEDEEEQAMPKLAAVPEGRKKK